VKVISTLNVQPRTVGASAGEARGGPAVKRSEEPVTVRVSVQDVTLADASSITVARTAVEAAPDSLEGPYELDVDLVPGRQYAVYVHVDRSGDGAVVPGDLINTVRVPLRATAPEDEVLVEVPVHAID
jgi:hypothetical protein